jgi:phenylpropionate dioxygenase-like ring-hydroxylating dioxygenase large terminal subunit
MLSYEHQELLTRVGPGMPMARMLREYWLPAARSASLAADGKPQRVRLFGENYVVFRAANGDIGFLDEACPHRGASLALARNEGNGLVCIYHGWKFDVAGRLLEAPCEAANPRQKEFMNSIVAGHYPVREAGGMVWVYLGARRQRPDFPMFEFNQLGEGHIKVRRALLDYNWLQGLEAHLDAAHLAVLHSSTLGRFAGALDSDSGLALKNLAPEMEMEMTHYGMREAAIRPMPDGTRYARMRHLILPFFTMVPSAPNSPCSGRAIVPIDDEHTAEWYFIYRQDRPISETEIKAQWLGAADDDDNFAANLGDAGNMWHQDRAALKGGHWSGLTRCIPFEDFTVSSSMGVRMDRTKEKLGPSDMVLVHARKALLDALEAFQADGSLAWQGGADFARLRATTATLSPGEDWRVTV